MRNLLTIALVLAVGISGLSLYRSSDTSVDDNPEASLKPETVVTVKPVADEAPEPKSPGLDRNNDGVPDDFEAYLNTQSGDVKSAAKQLSQAYFAVVKEFLADASIHQNALHYTRSLACLSSVLADDIAARFEVLGALLNTQERRSLVHAIDLLIGTGVTIDFTGSGEQFGAIVTRNPTQEVIKAYEDIDEFQIEAIAAYCDFESEIVRNLSLKRFSEDTGVLELDSGIEPKPVAKLPVPKLGTEEFTSLEAPERSVNQVSSSKDAVLEAASDINQALRLEGNCWFYSYAVSDVAFSMKPESIKLAEMQKIHSAAVDDRCIK